MRKMKKLLSILVAATMTLAMAATSFASPIAEEDDDRQPSTATSIIVNGATKGHTYTAYKILEATVDTENTSTVAYKVTTAWKNFIGSNEAAGNLFDLTDMETTGYVTPKAGVGETEAAAFAKAAIEAITSTPPEVTASAAGSAIAGEDGTATIAVSGYGYYLVDSTVGTLCALDSNTPNVAFEDKSQAPTYKKEVATNSNATPGRDTNANVGDTVYFTVTIDVKAGAENYTVTDTMTKLTLDDDSFVVTADGTPLTKDTDYKVNVANDKKSFTLELASYFTGKTEAQIADQILVKYSATIDADAVGEVNVATNKAELSYGNGAKAEPTNPGDETVKVYTYAFDLSKIDGVTKAPLTGAEFRLYDAPTGGNEITLHKASDNLYRKAVGNEEAEVIQVGSATIEGLAAGTYYLEETKSPDGYNRLTERRAVIVSGEGQTSTSVGIAVENNAGSLLPSTGGIGTTIFYAAGIILMAGAVFFVVRRRRA